MWDVGGRRHFSTSLSNHRFNEKIVLESRFTTISGTYLITHVYDLWPSWTPSQVAFIVLRKVFCIEMRDQSQEIEMMVMILNENVVASHVCNQRVCKSDTLLSEKRFPSHRRVTRRTGKGRWMWEKWNMVPVLLYPRSYPLHANAIFSHTRAKQGWKYEHNEDAHTPCFGFGEGGNVSFRSVRFGQGQAGREGTINFYNLCSRCSCAIAISDLVCLLLSGTYCELGLVSTT